MTRLECIQKHQLAGLDERERGFNRVVELERIGEGYRAILKYETSQIVTDARETDTAALQTLIADLHRRGYAQLRSQLSFRGNTYFGSKEPWIEYPDPARPSRQLYGLWSRFIAWFQRG